MPNVVHFYHCPANTQALTPGTPDLTNFVGIAGIGPDAAALPKGDRRAGVFGYERQIGVKDITDEHHTTLMVIETGFENGPWAAGGFATTRGLDPARPPYLGADAQFSSNHVERATSQVTGITNAAFVDASCRSLSEKIDPEVLEAMATISGGEKVTLPAD